MTTPATKMTSEAFSRLIQREDHRVELKTGLGRRPIQEALVAMSNTSGGQIFFGVTDDRRVIGKQRTQGVDDAIHEAALTATNVGRYAIDNWTIDGVEIVVVKVDARHDEVAQTSDGRVLQRRGGRNVAVFGADLWTLMTSRSTRRYEEADSGVSTADVDADLAASVAGAHGWTKSDDPSVWEQRGLLHSSGSLTVAGALVLTHPARTLGAAKFHVDIRSYESDDASSYVRREVIDGPIQHQVDEATNWVLRDIGTELIITGARRHDVPRLPPRTVREAVANAVAHRDYSIDRTPCVIEVRPSFVRVTSPGALPAPVTVDRLRESQAPRNHTMIDILRKFGLAEDSGQGIDVMQDDMRDEFLLEPAFTEHQASFEVELSLGGLVSTTERAWLAEYEQQGTLQKDDRLLLLAAVREKEVTNARAREILNADSVDARRRLQRLRHTGLIVQHGTRGRAFYTPGIIGPARSEEEILLEAAEEAPLTNSRVRALLSVERNAARAILQRMVREGTLIQIGQRRGSRYLLPHQANDD